ncbi:LmeA family phospholipid-binding protein [Streptomyces sp. P1-3]|uniref:LmeA family phospholipid-binding protein n=1 Tax=Streptomyces sp. P1-3 TaxID=3421658 RepID=UPI003D35DC4C
MRTPTRISTPPLPDVTQPLPQLPATDELAPRNPYDELAELADPYDPDDPLGLGLKPDEAEAEDEAPWSPPNHRKRKRGRRRPLSGVSLLLKLVIAAAACTVILVLADRCAVMYAEREAAQRVQKQLGLEAAPEVEIRGFPFLTQVLDGRLDQVDVTIPDVPADRVSLAQVRASARDIRIVGSLPDSVEGATVDSLDGDVLLSFDDMNRELGASQVRFTGHGPESVLAAGKLPVAGQEVQVRAKARIKRDGARGISTDITGMRLDIPEVATYRPGKHAGLRLHRESAERIAQDAGKAKAMLAVPSLARRLGVPDQVAAEALHNDARLHEITSSPRFVEALMRVNLVDAVTEHPWVLERIGIDPKLAAALTRLQPPELSERLALSFQLPEKAGDLRLRNITVERDGIHADLAGDHLDFGKAKE